MSAKYGHFHGQGIVIFGHLIWLDNVSSQFLYHVNCE